MSKDKKKVPYEDVPRESESPTHKKRREEREKLDRVKRVDFNDLDEYEFETFEPVKKKNGRG